VSRKSVAQTETAGGGCVRGQQWSLDRLPTPMRSKPRALSSRLLLPLASSTSRTPCGGDNKPPLNGLFAFERDGAS
jgi:hypothetical protein